MPLVHIIKLSPWQTEPNSESDGAIFEQEKSHAQLKDVVTISNFSCNLQRNWRPEHCETKCRMHVTRWKIEDLSLSNLLLHLATLCFILKHVGKRGFYTCNFVCNLSETCLAKALRSKLQDKLTRVIWKAKDTVASPLKVHLMSSLLISFLEAINIPGGRGGVLPSIQDRCVSQKILIPWPI